MDTLSDDLEQHFLAWLSTPNVSDWVHTLIAEMREGKRIDNTSLHARWGTGADYGSALFNAASQKQITSSPRRQTNSVSPSMRARSTPPMSPTSTNGTTNNSGANFGGNAIATSTGRSSPPASPTHFTFGMSPISFKHTQIKHSSYYNDIIVQGPSRRLWALMMRFPL